LKPKIPGEYALGRAFFREMKQAEAAFTIFILTMVRCYGSLRPMRAHLFAVRFHLSRKRTLCYSLSESEGAAGRARTIGDCVLRALRGGSWNYYPPSVRSVSRFRFYAEIWFNFIGFRVAGTLTL
jgi:hypothetical protein